MNPSRSLCLAVVAGALAFCAASAQPPKGSLFIIGGGHRTPEMMRQFVDLAGGPEKAKLVVIPNASADGDTSCRDMADEFRALGVRRVDCCLLTHEQASDPRSAGQLDGATGVYFTGGDQALVTRALSGRRSNGSCWSCTRRVPSWGGGRICWDTSGGRTKR